MKTIIRKLTLCALLLGASTSAHAAFVPFPDGEFTAGKGTWGEAGPAPFSYPASDGASGGYGAINANGSWGIWVNNNNDGSFIPLASLGLVAGNGYTFKMDMRIEAGSNTNTPGDLKLEWQGGGDTGDMASAYIGAGWNTYTYNVIIPASATGLKVVPVANDNNHVGFDNIGFESVPYFIAPPPPTDVVLQDPFDVASTNWVAGAAPPGGTSSVTWSNTEGNPAGSTIIAATNPAGAGANVAFTYTRTGVDFGTTGPVQISFDAKGTALVATALHVRYNGNFIGAIQGSFNDTTYTTYTQTFNLNQGFETDTFTLVFELATGAVPGSGGSFSIDNIKVLSNLPDGQPFSAEIAMGTMVGWTPTAAENIYQPQESADNTIWTDLGPAYTGTSVSSLFDLTPAPFYRVEEIVPLVEEAAYNGGFEELFFGDLDGWELVQQAPTLITTDAHTGTNSVQILANATVADPGPPATYSAGVSVLQQNTTNAMDDAETGGPYVTPGETYDFSFWYKQVNLGPGYVQQFKVTWLGTSGITGVGVDQNFTGATGVWEQKVITGMVAPAGTVSAQILIQGATGAFEGSTGEVIIDDVSLETTGAGSTNLLAATSAPAAEISWESTTGMTYNVGSSTDLNGFAPFAGPFAGNDSIQRVYDSPLVGKKFYQVSEQ
jgi:hypothetical protein